MRILVVEDDPRLGEELADALREETYAVDLAPTGAAASELAAVNEYDLVVLDWKIPSPSGIELLRGWRAEGRQTPVLMLPPRQPTCCGGRPSAGWSPVGTADPAEAAVGKGEETPTTNPDTLGVG